MTLIIAGILSLPAMAQQQRSSSEGQTGSTMRSADLPESPASVPGAALHFDGTNDLVSNTNPAFDFNTGTAECWFNTAPSTGNKCVMAMRNSTSGARWSIHVNEGGNEIGFFNGASYIGLPAVINANTWYHLAVVMNTTNTYVYLNGTAVGTISLGLQASATGQPFSIGGHYDLAWPEYFNGMIDEVRIWNRALCASEIQNNRNGEIPAAAPGLIANYHFNEGVAGANNVSVISLPDASGNNIHLVLNGFLLSGLTSNWISPGAVTSGSSITPYISTSVSSANVTCNGAGNGTATVTASGVGPFTYNWAPAGGTGPTASGLAPGTYTCTINGGCASVMQTVTITQPAAISLSTVVTHISCASSNDGAIDLTVTGGTGPFSYDWSFGYTTEDISGLYPGTYMVTVTDANGCTATSQMVSVSYSSTLSTSLSIAPFPCNSPTTTATVTASGGTPGYTYSWSPSGGNGATSTPLTPGYYSCTVQDAAGCISSQSMIITTPATLTATSAVTSNYNGFALSCYNAADGEVTVTPSGGTPPYSYMWNNGGITQTINYMPMGAYTCTVTCSGGCVYTTTPAFIQNPPQLTAGSVVTPVSCTDTSSGAIDLTPAGGAGSYTFAWSNSANTEDISGLTAGVYSVTLTDINGCTTTASVTVTPATAPAVSYTEPMDSVCQLTTAPFTLSGAFPAGGTWSGTGVTDTIFNPGNAAVGFNVITYTYTDNLGCTGSATDSVYVDICTGVDENALQTMHIYPNPSGGYFNLQLETPAAVMLELFAADGRLMLREQYNGTTAVTLNLSEEAAGIYFLRLTSGDTIKTAYLMRQ